MILIWNWKHKNFIHKHRPVSTSREPQSSQLESQCERSHHITLRYLQGANLVERRQVHSYISDVVNQTYVLCPPILKKETQ